MLIANALLVTLGALIMGAGLIVIIRIVETLRVFDLARPWIILAALIFFFLIGYVFTVLRFLDIVMLPGVTMEALVSAIFFFGALFVLTLAVLNLRLFREILGRGISDQEAYRVFSEYVGMPTRKVMAMTEDDYTVACDICGGEVHYSIPELVKMHPQIDRGVVVERAMGGTNYRFFVRHYCGKELREIPVRHDSQFQYRSQRPSRPVWIMK